MRDDWKIKALGDICGYQNGFAFKSKTYRESGIPVIRISDIQDKKIDLSGIVHIDSKDYNKDLSRYEIVKGDLLIAMSGATTGKIGIVQTDDTFLLNQRVGKFEPEEELNKRYLFYYLLEKVEEVLNMSAGSAQPNLGTKQIKGFQIPLPPLSEQKRIVAILDEAFEAIDQAKANIEWNIENAEELFQSKVDKIFSQRDDGWEKKRLDEVCENLDRLREPISKKKREKGPYPYYGASGIVDYVADYIFNEDLLLVSEDGANLLARTYPIAFSINGKNWVNNHAHVLKFVNMASQRFIEYYLNSIKLDSWISGMAQPKLNQRNLNSIPVPFPVLSEQKRVINKLDKLESEIESIATSYEKKVSILNELKKSILQQAFSGALTKNKSGFTEFEDKQDKLVGKAAEAKQAYEIG